VQTPPRPRQAALGAKAFSVYTAGNGSELPGQLVRAVGDPASGDEAVDEAYAGVQGSLALFKEVYGRDSFDGHGAPVLATVHYERGYDNAFWDGNQLVFGDGDGKVFQRFTKPVDVLGHELSHAVTQYTANLTYQGQSGALNESVSDVFGSCLKQRLLGQSVDEADWLIGEGIFTPSVHGKALRSMAAPGTAYDDPALGKDPQVAHMKDYVDTSEDNGGVHTNSGIPNKAFHLAATAIGGTAWDGAGRIWYAALTSGIGSDTDFAGFAAATVEAAGSAADAVRQAWEGVGVSLTGGSTGNGSPTHRADTVAVTRSGGFAGIRQTGEATLGDDPRTPEIESLLGRIDFGAVAPPQPMPDRFVYTFHVQGEQVSVGEQDLTPDLQQLASLLLGTR
jgi:Zn-dependent metalloprotease